MKYKLILLTLGVFIGIASATFWLISQNLSSESIEFGRVLKNRRSISEMHLQDFNGKSFGREQLLGKWSLITFGFTHCPDVCPTALAAFRDELNLLEDNRNRVQFIFVSIDPERDTPEVLQNYITYFHKNIIGLTGTIPALKALAKNFGVHFQKSDKGEDYTMVHSPQFFLINPEAELTAMYSPPLARGKIAMDLSRIAGKNSL